MDSAHSNVVKAILTQRGAAGTGPILTYWKKQHQSPPHAVAPALSPQRTLSFLLSETGLAVKILSRRTHAPIRQGQRIAGYFSSEDPHSGHTSNLPRPSSVDAATAGSVASQAPPAVGLPPARIEQDDQNAGPHAGLDTSCHPSPAFLPPNCARPPRPNHLPGNGLRTDGRTAWRETQTFAENFLGRQRRRPGRKVGSCRCTQP